jgi:uncharacterized protein GlcG (DUF336 family)
LIDTGRPERKRKKEREEQSFSHKEANSATLSNTAKSQVDGSGIGQSVVDPEGELTVQFRLSSSEMGFSGTPTFGGR